jgi:alanine-glyoxylate transaminase/serine-glyoxylate transaminase/serine-pyruvate transaminase
VSDYHLMIPGPVALSPQVLAEMAEQVVAHYGKDWTNYYSETLSLLSQVFQTRGDIFAIPGSGTAGLDAAIGSISGDGSAIMVVSNGFFGDRLADIARTYSPRVVVHRLDPTVAISSDFLSAALRENRSVKAVSVVHCETSTGLLNPVRELAKVCQDHGALFIVDAISSLGGAELRMDDWGIGICISASQKCLEGPPGLTLVAVGERAWSVIEQCHTPGWYLNLRTWKQFSESWRDWHPYPVTMAVPALRGLRKALESIVEEGLDERFQRHQRIANLVRNGLTDLGFELLVTSDVASPTVTASKGNAVLSANALIDGLRDQYSIQIAGGMGELKGQIFRIGHMGSQAKEEQVLPLVRAIRSLLEGVGWRLKREMP